MSQFSASNTPRIALLCKRSRLILALGLIALVSVAALHSAESMCWQRLADALGVP